MENNKYKVGACFTYSTRTDKTKFGFIVVEVADLNKEKYIQFAVTNIPGKEKIVIDDFIAGTVYGHQIPVGITTNEYRLGIYCFFFDQKSVDSVDELEFIGEIDVDKSKFTIGSGTGGIPEPVFSTILERFDMFIKDKEIINVSTILK